MTERENELIERLMQGDMEAYDELMPNARPEDRAMFENAMKKAKEYGVQDTTFDSLHIRDMICFNELDIKKMS